MGARAGIVIHPDHDDTADIGQHGFGMPAGIAMALHVLHFACESLCQPSVQVLETIRLGRRRNAEQLEAQLVGVLLQSLFDGSVWHVESGR
jgi:hypothetical protein